MKEKTGLRLAGSTRPPFLHPKDPFVVLKADNLVGVDRVRGLRPAKDANDPQPPLDCRLASEVVTGVEMSGGVSKTLLAEVVLPLEKNLARSRPCRWRVLALETLLFDPNSADLIDTGDSKLFSPPFRESRQVADVGRNQKHTDLGRPASGWPERHPLGRAQSLAAGLSVVAGELVGGVCARARARREQRQRAASGLADRSGAAEGVQGPRAGDLVPKSGSVQLEKAPTIEGATIISAVAGTTLAKSLGDFAEAAGLTTNQDDLKWTQFLGQSLGGFNDLLLRQTLGLCLPPFDPTKQPSDQRRAGRHAGVGCDRAAAVAGHAGRGHVPAGTLWRSESREPVCRRLLRPDAEADR